MSYLPVIAAVAMSSTATLAVVVGLRTTKLRTLEWGELLAQLEPVDAAAIERLAMDHMRPVRGQLTIEPGEMWEMVGGLAGLERMRANAQVMCALAAYAERWNFDEAVIVTERIRREAATVRSATRHVAVSHYLSVVAQAKVPFYVEEAATAYHLMRRRLLALYETSHQGRYPALAGAL